MMSTSCDECSGELTIIGSGFDEEPPAGDDGMPILMQVLDGDIDKGNKLTIVSWTDTEIIATGADCSGSEITINGFSAKN
jgi:hypothetical protein